MRYKKQCTAAVMLIIFGLVIFCFHNPVHAKQNIKLKAKKIDSSKVYINGYSGGGESDEYYSSKPFKEAYQKLHGLYRKQGLCEKQIQELLVLDVKKSSYFAGTGVTYQHAASSLFCWDQKIMNWLFEK